MAVMLLPLPRLLRCRRSIWENNWFPAPKECPRHLPTAAGPCSTSLGHPNSTCLEPGELGRIRSLFLSSSLPAPFPHVLTAEADADDEDDEGDDGGDQGDDDDLALVPSQVEQIHPLAASPGVASLAPGRHRGGTGRSQKLPVPPSRCSPGEDEHSIPPHPVPPCPHRG